MFFGLLAGVAASTNLTVDGSHSLAAGVHTFDVLHVTATGTLTINGVVEIIASVVEVGAAEISTWAWDTVHMPTGYLQNVRLRIPDDGASVGGLCEDNDDPGNTAPAPPSAPGLGLSGASRKDPLGGSPSTPPRTPRSESSMVSTLI